MTSIQAVQGSSAQQIDLDGLTPDALLIYVQTALGALDTDIQGYLDKQKQIVAEKKALHDIEALMGAKQPKNKEDLLEMYRNANAQISGLPPGDPVRNAAHKLLVDFVNAHRKGGGTFFTYTATISDLDGMKFQSISDDQWKELDENLKNIGADASSTGETNMIQLQSLMSRRQTAVQLTTNLMNKLDQSYDAVVRNI